MRLTFLLQGMRVAIFLEAMLKLFVLGTKRNGKDLIEKVPKR